MCIVACQKMPKIRARWLLTQTLVLYSFFYPYWVKRAQCYLCNLSVLHRVWPVSRLLWCLFFVNQKHTKYIFSFKCARVLSFLKLAYSPQNLGRLTWNFKQLSFIFQPFLHLVTSNSGYYCPFTPLHGLDKGSHSRYTGHHCQRDSSVTKV